MELTESGHGHCAGICPSNCPCKGGCPWECRGHDGGATSGATSTLGNATFGHTRCTPGSAEYGPEKVLGAHVITFPRSGIFVMEMEGDRIVADPNHVLFCNRGSVFRTSHPASIGDETDWISIGERLLMDIVTECAQPGGHRGGGGMGRVGPRRFSAVRTENVDRPFEFTHGHLNPGDFLAARSLFTYIKRGQHADPIRVEEMVLRLVGRVVSAAYGSDGVQGRGGSARVISIPESSKAASKENSIRGGRDTADAKHARLVDGVKGVLSHRFHERLTIDEVATTVGSSPFHLCRVFRNHAGMPIHRYLNRLRLRAAMEFAEDPRVSLADIAMDVGFCSHSHFSDAFRREFGLTPSAARELVRSGALIDAA